MAQLHDILTSPALGIFIAGMIAVTVMVVLRLVSGALQRRWRIASIIVAAALTLVMAEWLNGPSGLVQKMNGSGEELMPSEGQEQMAKVYPAFLDLAQRVGLEDTILEIADASERDDAESYQDENGDEHLLLASGALEFYTPEQLRAVIAHELGHLALGHTSDEATSAISRRGSWLIAGVIIAVTILGLLLEPRRSWRSLAILAAAGMVLTLASVRVFTWYVHNDEFAADRFAVELVGYEPVASFLRSEVKSEAEERARPQSGIWATLDIAWETWWATHPSPELRLRRIHTEAQRSGIPITRLPVKTPLRAKSE